MAKKPIDVMCTAFRDGFQSVVGARAFTKDFIPAVKASCEAGIDHFESGGGARFQSLFLYCGENAFDMMDQFREAAPQANLQTLARGINVVGLDSQSSDVIDMHAKLFKKHGVTTIRNFDALNDVNNLIYSGQCIKKHGLRHEISVTMMALPPGCEGAHDPDFYEGILKQILEADVEIDSVCFKDASGTTTPTVVFETIKRARKLLGPDMPLRMHTHETAGTSVLVYKSALDAGANGIDLSMRPMSGGTGQPDVLTMWHALRGTEYDLQIDPDKVREAERIFKDCMKDYFMPPEATAVEPIIPWSPMPGGALTANTQMLRDNGLMDKYPEIIDKMKETVTRGGFGTSVTPVSQFYFQQAFNNVMFGDWDKIAEGYGKMVLGYFGKTPIAPDPEIVKLASEQLKLEPTTRDPRAINDEDPAKGLEVAEKKLQEAGVTDLSEENVFIAATCADKGIQFLQGKYTIGVRKNEAAAPAAKESSEGPVAMKVSLNGKDYNITLDGEKAFVNGKSYDFGISEGTVEQAGSAPVAAAGSGTMITAQMPGNIIRLEVSVGDSVEEGQPLMVVEAMKMETEIKSKATGTVGSILVDEGDKIVAGQDLVEIV
jgi:pyruvate carboxylase subunit B